MSRLEFDEHHNFSRFWTGRLLALPALGESYHIENREHFPVWDLQAVRGVGVERVSTSAELEETLACSRPWLTASSIGSLFSNRTCARQECSCSRCLPPSFLQEHPRDRPSHQRMEVTASSQVFGEVCVTMSSTWQY